MVKPTKELFWEEKIRVQNKIIKKLQLDISLLLSISFSSGNSLRVEKRMSYSDSAYPKVPTSTRG